MPKETVLWPQTKTGIIISLVCGIVLTSLFIPFLITDIEKGKTLGIYGDIFILILGLYSIIKSVIKLAKRGRAKRNLTIS